MHKFVFFPTAMHSKYVAGDKSELFKATKGEDLNAFLGLGGSARLEFSRENQNPAKQLT